jgi:prolyl oligopeptidase
MRILFLSFFLLVVCELKSQNEDSLFDVSSKNASVFTSYKGDVIDTIFGTLVPDPYRWLESLNSNATKDWLEKQRAITQKEKGKFRGGYMDAYSTLTNFSGGYNDNLIRKGRFYFSFGYDAEWYNQVYFTSPALFYRDSLNGQEYLAFDPNLYSRKDIISIEDFTVSDDGKYLVVCLSHSGSDWRQIRVKNIRSQKNLPDTINCVKFSNIVWWDNGFFYSRYKYPPKGGIQLTSNTQQQLYYHKLGEAQESDKPIYSVPDESNSVFRFELTSDNQYLIIYTKAKIKGKWCDVVMYKDLNEGVLSEMELLIATSPEEKANYEVIDMINGKFAVETNAQAPNSRILFFSKDSLNHATTFIPQYDEVLQSVYHVGKKLVCVYFDNGSYSACIFDYEGRLLTTISFDVGVSVNGFWGSPDDSVVLYTQHSFFYPAVVYKLNLNRLQVDVVSKTFINYHPEFYESGIVTYMSKDGTEIPMYLTYKKGLNLSGKNPVVLYGYGGFGKSITPYYNFSSILFFANGGILAVPMIRGGGEFGEKWHEEGSRLKKQNSFDDFISAAEFLIANNYTTKEKLIIKGSSNGGLLVGAMLTQRPDLFKAAIAEMGIFDMLRYPRFTGGRFWADEYGDPANPYDFQNLLNYSPYHNVKENKSYPATLLVTAANDDRVPPFHTYKFLAALQAKSGDQKPHILYSSDNAGHKGPRTIEASIKQEAFELAFVLDQLGMKLKPGF